MNNKSTLVILLSLASLLGSNIAGAAQQSRTALPSGGRVNPKNIEVYFNKALTIPLYGINWGDLVEDSTTARVVYLYNPSKTSFTLSLSASNWDPPEASSYLSLTWDREGYTLEGGSSINATIEIHVSADVVNITDFAHEIVISGVSP